MKKIYLIALLLVGICGYGQTPAFKNTALEYCKGLGYKIIEDPSTKQRQCVLPNGERVNPWDFFHGNVGKEYSYCAKMGNHCGSSVSETFYIACPMCSDSPDFMAVAFPNPASNELTVNIEDNSGESAEYQIEILDSNLVQRKHRKTKDLVNRFYVEDLRDGKYTVWVKALIDGKIIREKSFNIIIAR